MPAGMAPKQIFPLHTERCNAMPETSAATAGLPRSAAGVLPNGCRLCVRLLSRQGGFDLLHCGVSDRSRYSDCDANLIGRSAQLPGFGKMHGEVRDGLNADRRRDRHKLGQDTLIRSEGVVKLRPRALAAFAPAVHAPSCRLPDSKSSLHHELNTPVTCSGRTCSPHLKLRAWLATCGYGSSERNQRLHLGIDHRIVWHDVSTHSCREDGMRGQKDTQI